SYEFGDRILVVTQSGPLPKDSGGRRRSLTLSVPPHRQPIRWKFLLWQGATKDRPAFEAIAKASPPAENLSALLKPGPTRWKPLTTKGEIGKDNGPFA